MAKKWAEIFADKNTFGDDFTVVLKDKDGKELSYTMGQLREANEESNGSLLASITKRERELKTQTKTLEEAQQAFGELVGQFEEVAGGSVATIAEKLKKGGKITKKEIATAAGLDENDPLVGDVVKQMNALKGEFTGSVDGIKGEVGKLVAAMGQIGSVALNDHYERRFEKFVASLPKGVDRSKLKDLTLEKVLEAAKTNNIRDPKTNLFDIDRVMRDQTAEFVEEARVNERVESEIKRREEEAQLAAIPKPGKLAGQNLPKPHKGYDPAKSADPLGDAFEAAMNDTDLWRELGVVGQAS